MCQCQADTATRTRLARHGPARVPTWPDTVRHGSAWRGLAWQIEVRGLANRSEGLANRSEGLGSRAGLGPVDKSDGFSWAGLAQGPSIKVRGSGSRAALGLSTRGTHAQPLRIGTIKDECVGRATLGVEVIALGDGTLVDR